MQKRDKELIQALAAIKKGYGDVLKPRKRFREAYAFAVECGLLAANDSDSLPAINVAIRSCAERLRAYRERVMAMDPGGSEELRASLNRISQAIQLKETRLGQALT